MNVATPARGRARRGPDPTPLTPERSELAARPEALEMARSVARHFARRAPDSVADDIASAALWGLALAARRFDPARGVPFHGYARHRVVGAVRDFLRRHPKYEASLDSCGPDGGGMAGSIPFELDAAF